MQASDFPRRIVALCGEAVEFLFLIGEGHRLVGRASHCLYPQEARQLPNVGGFTSVDVRKVMELQPDLVIASSNLQAAVVREIVQCGVTTIALNPYSLKDVFDALRLLGRVVGRETEAEEKLAQIKGEMERIRNAAANWNRRPRVYFEEWNEPMICGIWWVSDMIEWAGGEDIFRDRACQFDAIHRIVSPKEVLDRQAEVVFLSWCGKKANVQAVKNRPGWEKLPAVRDGMVWELDSSLLLQPGPRLLEGLKLIHHYLAQWASRHQKRGD